MRIIDFVDPAAVLFRLDSDSRAAVVGELARGLASAYPALDPARVQAALEERERLGTTGIGRGVAAPHGKLREAEAYDEPRGEHDAERLAGREPDHHGTGDAVGPPRRG